MYPVSSFKESQRLRNGLLEQNHYKLGYNNGNKIDFFSNSGKVHKNVKYNV